MDKKNKINIKLFEDFKDDQKYYSFVYTQLFNIIKFLNGNGVKIINTEYGNLIDGGEWKIEGWPSWPSGDTHKSNTLLIQKDEDCIAIDYNITETEKHTFSDVTGPDNAFDIDVDVDSITYSIDNNASDIEIKVTREIEDTIIELINSIANTKTKNTITPIVKEGFAANSGLAKVIRLLNGPNDYFSYIPNSLKSKIKELGITSSTIFSFASMFPRDSFKIQDIISGKLERQIKFITIDGEYMNKSLEQVKALKELVTLLDTNYGGKSWTTQI